MIIISFELSYLTIQLRFTKLSPFFWWYHCAICTCVYLHFYFAVICWDIFPCLLALNFSFGFRQVFLRLHPPSVFTEKGLLPDEELSKAIAWLLNCKLSVISVIDIVGFALIPSGSLSFASGSLKPEINFIFTNSSSGLAGVLSFCRSHNSMLPL